MKIRKAILTGGGRATRLRPITSTINKHLIKLAGKPMIFYAIEKVVAAGIEEIYINTNPGDTELQTVIGDGSRWGIKIKFFEQTGGPQGIAHLVNLAKKFIKNEPFIFYLSDNIILNDLKPLIEKFNAGNYDCMLALSKVDDPKRFGVPVFESGKLVDVLEKPQNPPNNFAVTGIYLYGPKVFFKAYKNIKKSERGEYEISDIHSWLLKKKYNVGYEEITGWWKDTGKTEDLIHANGLLLEKLPQLGEGYVDVKDCVNTEIKAPLLIGKNCQIKNCTLGKNVSIGDGCVLENVAISDSIIFDNCKIICREGKIKIHQSILGKNTSLTYQKGNEVSGRVIIGDNGVVEV